MEQVFPLQWPAGRPRTASHRRAYSRFDVTPGKAQNEMHAEISKMGGRNVVVSTNLRVRQDGGIYAADANKTPDDPGVAVYFERKGDRVAFCCDQYPRIWENMRAIGKTIEAMRGIERWGSAEMLDRAFTGFTALPSGAPPWWETLGCSRDAGKHEMNAAYRAKARGASEAHLKALNLAKDDAFASLT